MQPIFTSSLTALYIDSCEKSRAAGHESHVATYWVLMLLAFMKAYPQSSSRPEIRDKRSTVERYATLTVQSFPFIHLLGNRWIPLAKRNFGKPAYESVVVPECYTKSETRRTKGTPLSDGAPLAVPALQHWDSLPVP